MAHRRRVATVVLLVVMWYQGVATPLLAVASPWISRRFSLDARALARLYAIMSVSALITFGSARLADRIGRRRLLVACLALTSVAAAFAVFARSIGAFTLWEFLRFSTAGAIANSAYALLVEAAPDSSARAAVLGKAGMAAAAGGASLLVLMPLFAKAGHTYRWAYGLATAGALLIPVLLSRVPESRHWQRALASGALKRSSVLGVFRGRWSRRAVAVIAASLLGGVEGAAVGAWSYYYGVVVVGVSPQAMSLLSVVATAVGFVGFRAGAWAADKYGRVPTTVGFGLLHQAAALWIYLGPPRHHWSASIWIGFGLCVSALGASGSGIAKSTASVELFPTPVRVTILGWIALSGAVATGLSNLMLSRIVAPLGGVSHAIALLSLSGVVGLLIFGSLVDETRGLTLEQAAFESERSS